MAFSKEEDRKRGRRRRCVRDDDDFVCRINYWCQKVCEGLGKGRVPGTIKACSLAVYVVSSSRRHHEEFSF